MEGTLFILTFILQLVIAVTDVSSCSCGFADSKTGAIWTDALIAYANETGELPERSLIAEDFQNPYEKNWNARYRAGAKPSNLGHEESTRSGWNGTAWTLKIDPPTKDHIVLGASLRSIRRDIQYGTFEAALGAPKPGVGGSIFAMRLDYNETQTVNLNVMNADAPKDAWTSFMIYGDWRGTRSKGVNFSDFGNRTYGFQDSPWGFVPYRIDWNNATDIDFFIGDALARSIRSKGVAKPLPVTPMTLRIQHSSIGDMYTSEGPPPDGSDARVGMLRAFFNSSSMTSDDHDAFDKRCHLAPACLVSDTSLRGASNFTLAASRPWEHKTIDYKKRWPAIFVVSISAAISTILLAHATSKRAPWKPKEAATTTISSADPPVAPTAISSGRTSRDLSTPPSFIYSEHDALAFTVQMPGMGTPGQATPGSVTPRASMPTGSSHGSSQVFWALSRDSLDICKVDEKKQAGSQIVAPCVEIGKYAEKKQVEVTVKEIGEMKHPVTNHATLANAKPPITAAKQRVDYLAGLVALASILVTLIHFALTFLPATEIPYTHAHYESEIWALKIVTPYLLTFSWIGPFFTSSTRFLIASYLKSGNLKGIAEKTVGRTPRLIIPCAAIAALEYFCMQVGATNWLEYLPSVTWSTWPYTAGYVTFGHFLSEILELMYIIPNAVPQITFNYCIGVLWTIPVQLQNSWLSLLAVIVIREIKAPWKRMGYYAFCILMHYYAMSWGTFFWVGLLIADLDLTYKWKEWLYSRPWVYYPFLTFVALLAVGSPSIDLVGMWKANWNFNTLEFGIHPHQRTGHAVRDSSDYGYPAYYLPRLTALTFSIGFHLLVELSTVVQKFFSNRLLMWLFPHILTLYLIHGLVFWSLGAAICVHLAAHNVPYWANMLVVAICTYSVIFGCLPLLTPILEGLGKSITQKIWQDASSKPPPRRKTLYPFSPEMFQGNGPDGEAMDDVESQAVKEKK
ncbi:uncharacterized protein N0V89_000782 [Didymosphaeria variabile]|uniref:GH16 domain-containing protein n=1 Tax=Didymosphaeria variabile TaxID=1932322 RepID=A0A9W8XXF4_9PLEO|nr:uncharacterized protein N0V89_000782 [Didymosphaeria variabile]KAJ4360222.1 hypothetical protein N0V89_000782 [Didymosphaeria variabile]